MPPEENGHDLVGYSSVEDLAKGYRASSDEAKRLKTRADQLEQRLGEIEQSFTRQSVPRRENPADTLSEFGVPMGALEELISDRVTQGVRKAFEPIARGAVARTTIMSDYPDYTKYEADVARFIESDPNLAQSYPKMFEADPVGAMEYALLKFGETKRKETPPNGEPQRKARAEAQIPSARQGDARTLPGANQDDLLARTWDHYQKSGDPRPFAKARLKQVISDDFLNRG